MFRRRRSPRLRLPPRRRRRRRRPRQRAGSHPHRIVRAAVTGHARGLAKTASTPFPSSRSASMGSSPNRCQGSPALIHSTHPSIRTS